MFQERFGSSSSRSRVHSAPPIDAQKKRLSLRSTHARAPENSLHKPATPDPENLYRILQARISSALSGPELKLRKRNSDESSIESKKLFPGKTSRDIYGSNSKFYSAVRTINATQQYFTSNEDIPPPVDQYQLCCILIDVKDGNDRRGMAGEQDYIVDKS